MTKFTQDEKRVLIFILAALFVGTGVFWYKKANPRHYQLVEFGKGKTYGSEKININKAEKPELIKIKGIGPVLADRIISYREKYGYFRRKEDLIKVKGIGDKTYDKIKEEILIE